MTDRGRRDYLLQVPTRKLHLVLPVVRAVAVMNPLSRRNDRILHNRGGASGVDMLEEQNYCDAGFRTYCATCHISASQMEFHN
ncbi:uncharacterized protein [Physcomitrium patens]|uniref:uncharacterized protein isoform X2 n=1 Tax=Physcomitrium patens TaxID=3218 RepID=UPI003CCD1D05